MNRRASLAWVSRRCWWQVSNGQPGVYGYCPNPPTVTRHDRGWCSEHDPDKMALELAFAMLIQVTRKAA